MAKFLCPLIGDIVLGVEMEQKNRAVEQILSFGQYLSFAYA